MSFSKGPGDLRPPFGKNVYYRSDRDLKFDSATIAADSVVAEDIGGHLIKVMQSGEVVAKITSGPNKGKHGPFQAGGTDEVMTLSKTGTVSGGTYTISHPDLDGETANINATDNAAAIQAAVDDWLEGQDAAITVSGGPVSTTPVVFTWDDDFGIDRQALVVDSAVTGGGSIAFAETTPGAEGATDGRQTAANIVGLLDTFLPWELNHRDHHASVCYEGTVVQGWCFERNAAGVRIPLTDTTRDAILANPQLALLFK
jgi:hypothetical protein